MKQQHLFLFFTLFVFSCGNETTKEGLVGRIASVQPSDGGFIVYSIETKEQTVATGRSNDAWDDITYEEAYLSRFSVQDTGLHWVYFEKTPCALESCGTHYTDRILAHGSHYLAMECHCSGDLLIIDLSTGKQILNKATAAQKYPELAKGIIEHRGEGRFLKISVGDGKVFQWSMDDLSLRAYQELCPMPQQSRSVNYAETNNMRYYFDSDANENQLFLVARTLQSGTSQSRLHRVGEPWLCAAFLATPDICPKPAQYLDNLFVLHASVWNDALQKDLLTMITSKGERVFTLDLKSIGIPDADYAWFLVQNDKLYVINGSETITVSLSNGQVLKRIAHSSWKRPATK